MSGALPTRYDQLVGMYSDTLDIVSVSRVMSLALLLNIEEHHHGGYEVYYLARW